MGMVMVVTRGGQMLKTFCRLKLTNERLFQRVPPMTLD
jgi:hypothetical protein